MNDPKPEDDNVMVKFETPAMRDERLEVEHRKVVQEEAIEMLERALATVKDRGVAGIAIAIAFDDGTYGRMIPQFSTNIGGLIAGITTAQHDLCFKTLTEEL